MYKPSWRCNVQDQDKIISILGKKGEIGIRMALGAQQGSVIWLVLRDVVAMLTAGAALGLAASLAAPGRESALWRQII